ncbi:hypothetical protein ABZ490_08350 [Streptomyces sp. NPDC005811]|uniref:hypothetical protein n=1 Tax=Streptomyces sp. NPDC005811 TaxID=3154565 RepID=UPI0033F14A67
MTVQLDTPHAAAAARQSASDAPVFVDESGRRSRTFRRIGILAGLACGAYAVVIVATLLSGNAGAPWLPVPGPDDDPPAGQVETTRAPSASAGTASGAPGFAAPRSPGVSASAGAPSRGGASGGPSASGSAAAPTGSTGARPSASGSPRASTASSATPSDPGPGNPVGGGSTSPQPTESTPDTSPPPDSSPTPADGTDTVADGAPRRAPVAASPGA